MSEEERAGQPQGFCPNCGAEVKPRNNFCVSCGERLVQGPASPNQTPSGSSQSGQFGSLANTLQETFRRLTQRFSEPSSASPKDTFLREVLDDLLRWFSNLPTVAKVAIVGLGVLVLLVLLSPLALLVAALIFGVSLIGLIVRMAQRKSVRGWGIVAVVSLVLMFTFAGISSVLYGDLLGRGSSKSGKDDKSKLPGVTSTPNYYIATSRHVRAGGQEALDLAIFSDSLRREDLRTIAEDIIETQEADWVTAQVYDSDTAVPDPSGGFLLSPEIPNVK